MKNIISYIFILMTLTGCLSTYKSPTVGPTAQIKTTKNAVVSNICINQDQNRLSPDSNGYAIIPAGKEIMMTAQYSEYINNMSYFCIPAVKFIPLESAIYIQKFNKTGATCTTEIYRKQNETEVLIATSLPQTFGCNTQ